MHGLFIYLIGAFVILPTAAFFVWRRYRIALWRQLEAVFFLCVSTAWLGAIVAPIGRTRIAEPASPKAAAPVDGRAAIDKVAPVALRQPQAQPSLGSALAYAAPETVAPARVISGPFGALDEWTAVYDISARTVYLPDGTMLEAHSGRGDRLDNPRYVHEPMKGATPPHIYELALREKPFHGVRALRLKPIGNGGVFGRTGLLAHTYMLGPSGESNGCVVFRDYGPFLQAFEKGEVKRLVVVARLD